MKCLSFWQNVSTKRKRVYSTLLVLLVTILAMAIGSFTPLGQSEAQFRSDALNQTINESIASNTLTERIFFNNFFITLLMFIPLVGAGLGLFIIYNTGVTLSALSTIHGYPAYLGILELMATPVFWLEFVAYSIAMAGSIWLFRRILQQRLSELKWTALSIGISALLLIIGAFVEVWLINAASL
jgi:hypothetical protein